MWPNAAKAPKECDIPKCSRCGAERQFEFQVCLAVESSVKNEE